METPENSLFSSSLFRIMYLLIEWEGHDVGTERFAMKLVGFCSLNTNKYV